MIKNLIEQSTSRVVIKDDMLKHMVGYSKVSLLWFIIIFMITFDTVLENQVLLGRFQWLTLFIVSLIDFSDGIEKTVIGTL